MMTGKIGQSQRKAVVRLSRDQQQGGRGQRDLSMYSLSDVASFADEPDSSNVQAMRVAFALFDKDGDGLISAQEVHDTMTSLGIKISSKEVKEIVKRVDNDRDGCINFAEFHQLMLKYPANTSATTAASSGIDGGGKHRSRGTGSADRELQDAFQVFDKDHDGFLNAHDLRSTMAQVGLILSEDDIHAMMKSVGIGPHGKISYSDFCRIYSNKTTADAEPWRNSFQPNSKLSKRQEDELRAVFKVFDMDKDGFITMDEVIQVLESMGFLPSQGCIDDIFRQVDLDGNGKIDFSEFLILVHNYERPLPEDVEMREMFNALDKDRNGYIDREELKRSFAELGLTLTDADVEAMMNEADVHADRIYFEDFVQMMTGKLCVAPSTKRLGSPLTPGTSSNAPRQPASHHAHQRKVTSSQYLPEESLTSLQSATTLSAPPATSKARQQVAHNERVAAVAEARRKRETSGGRQNNVNGGVHNAVETSSSLPTSQQRLLNSGLSFEVQEFFRESTSTETLPTIPSSQSSVENEPLSSCAVARSNAASVLTSANVDNVTNVPNTWLAFKVFDRNSDGYISKLELHKTMTDLGIDLSREDLDYMMDEADINKDGRIDYCEFSKLMKGSFEAYASQAAALHHRAQSISSASGAHTGNGAVTSGTGLTSARKLSAGATTSSSSPARRRPPPPPPPPNTRPPPVPPRPAPGTFSLPTLPNATSSSSCNQSAVDGRRDSDCNQTSTTTTAPAVFAVTGLGFAAEDEMRAAFQVFDLDRDGLIDSNELRLTMSHLGENLTDGDVDAMIRAVDRNDDGKIDYEEFLLMLKGSSK